MPNAASAKSREKHSNLTNYGYVEPHKLKLWIGFAASSNVITNLTNVEDFVKVL